MEFETMIIRISRPYKKHKKFDELKLLEDLRDEFPDCSISINDNALVRIFCEGGCIRDVKGLPEGIEYKIIDYDEICSDDSPSCGNCKNAENCELMFGSNDCKYEHIYFEKREKERKERQELELKAKIILLNKRREQIVKEILDDFQDNDQLKDFIGRGGKGYTNTVYKK